MEKNQTGLHSYTIYKNKLVKSLETWNLKLLEKNISDVIWHVS